MKKEYKALLITSLVFCAITLALVFAAYGFIIYAKNITMQEGSNGWEGLGAAIMWLLLSEGAAITDFVAILLSVIGLFVSNKKVVIEGVLTARGTDKSRKNFLILTISSILIIVVWVVLFLVFKNA